MIPVRERLILDLGRVCIADAKGKMNKLKLFSTRFDFRKLPHELPKRVRGKIYKRMRYGYVYPTILFSVFVITPYFMLCYGIVFFLIFIAGFGQNIQSRPLVMTLVLAQFAVTFLIASVLVEMVGMPRIRHRYRSVYTRAMLDHWLCPWCGYGLRGIPLNEDGHVMCPECTGHWVGHVPDSSE